MEWLRDNWPGKLVVKGVLDLGGARIAAQLGAHAIVVPNHGGRPLDGASLSICILPRVVVTVRGEKEVWLDSGVRRCLEINQREPQ